MKKIILVVLLFVFGASVDSHAYAPEISKSMDLIYAAKYKEAEALINGYISTHLDDPMGYIVRGTLFDWKQLVHGLKSAYNEKILADYELANKWAFSQWEKDPGNIDKLVNLGNSYLFVSKKWLDMGKTMRSGFILKKCQKHLEEAVAKDPNRYDAYMANGIFNFYAGNLPPGLSALAGILGISGDEQKGVQMVSKTADNDNLFSNHATFVLTYMYGKTKKDYAKALSYLERLTSRFPSNPYFWYLKGEYAMKAAQYDKSRQIFSTLDNICSAATCSKHHVFMKDYFIVEGLFKESKIDQAAPYLEKAIANNDHESKDVTTYLDYYKGMVLKSQGNAKVAKTYFQKVIDAPEGSKSAKELAAKELAK